MKCIQTPIQVLDYTYYFNPTYTGLEKIDDRMGVGHDLPQEIAACMKTYVHNNSRDDRQLWSLHKARILLQKECRLH